MFSADVYTSGYGLAIRRSGETCRKHWEEKTGTRGMVGGTFLLPVLILKTTNVVVKSTTKWGILILSRLQIYQKPVYHSARHCGGAPTSKEREVSPFQSTKIVNFFFRGFSQMAQATAC